MAAKKNIINSNPIGNNSNGTLSHREHHAQHFVEVACTSCNSTDIIETHEGHACRHCGLVLDQKKLAYHRPYDESSIQYATMGTTQIGLYRERMCHPQSSQFQYLNKLHLIKSNENMVIDEATQEMTRIFDGLDLPKSYKTDVFQKFKELRSKLRPGTKYRPPKKLIPLSIYFVFKYRGISINEARLLALSDISKKDFTAFKLTFQELFPDYIERDRKKYICQKILELTEKLEISMVFFYQAKTILYRFWDTIKNTTDDVIAGLVSSITLLCIYKGNATVSSICNVLGIKMSTIQAQVKRRIFEYFHISGFTTLKKSAALLREVMFKMGFIVSDPKQLSAEQVQNEADSSSLACTESQAPPQELLRAPVHKPSSSYKYKVNGSGPITIPFTLVKQLNLERDDELEMVLDTQDGQQRIFLFKK